jgi:hypothetical protein
VFADVLGSTRARQRGYFTAGFVDEVVRDHMSGRRDHSLRLWQLLVLELWQRQYVDAAAFSRQEAVGRGSRQRQAAVAVGRAQG